MNCVEFVDCDGMFLGCYDKIYFFDVDLLDGNIYCELVMVNLGRDLFLVVEILGFCNVGLFICYDVWFFEFYCYFVGVGVDLLMIFVVFMVFIGKDYW